MKRTDYAGALGFLAYSSSAVMTPVCLVALMNELSFSFSGGGGIEAVRASLIFGVLVVSGFAAARWGKAAVLAAGSFILAAGMFAYALAPVYAVVLAAVALVGIGSGIIEGLINPAVQDAHPQDSGKYLNIVNAFWSVGVMSTVLVTGELLTRGVSWRTLVAADGIVGIAAGVLFLAVRNRRGIRPRPDGTTAAQPAGSTNPQPAAGGSQDGTSGPQTVSETWRKMAEVLKTRRFWIFATALFFGGAAEGAFTFWSASYVQIHFQTLARAGGFATACFAGGMIVGRTLTAHYVRQNKLYNLIVATAVCGAAVSLFVFAIGSLPGFFVLLFAAGLSVACFWPSIQSYSADCLDVDTTMLFILISCAGIPGFGFASWLMGTVGDAAGIRTAFAIIPVFFVLLAVVIVVDRRRNRTPAQEFSVCPHGPDAA